VQPVRELEGKPVVQAILGGDSGTSLRDMLAAAALLKSKRVPPTLDFLVAPASRQVLEVLAQTGALVDLIATGARLLEPDHRVLTGELYPPPEGGLSIRTFTPAPGPSRQRPYAIASAETLAYAVSAGKIGDPRKFKRPVRVTVPRTLPTDDVLVVRKEKSKGKKVVPEGTEAPRPTRPPTVEPWTDATDLVVSTNLRRPSDATMFLAKNLDEALWVASRATEFTPHIRAVAAPFMPSSLVPLLSGLGVLALSGAPADLAAIGSAGSVKVSAASEWTETIPVIAGNKTYALEWRAVGAQREWARAGAK